MDIVVLVMPEIGMGSLVMLTIALEKIMKLMSIF